MLSMANIIFLSIPIHIILFGYYVKIMRTTLEGDINLPEWTGFFKIIIDGILLVIGQTIVSIAFMIIPLIIGIIGVAFLIFAESFEIIGHSLMFISILSFIPFMILNSLYIILANINFAKRGFFGFFDYNEVINKFSINYILLASVIFVFSLMLSITIVIIVAIPSILVSFIDNMALTFIFSLISSIISSTFSITLLIFSYRAYATYYKNVN